MKIHSSQLEASYTANMESTSQGRWGGIYNIITKDRVLTYSSELAQIHFVSLIDPHRVEIVKVVHLTLKVVIFVTNSIDKSAQVVAVSHWDAQSEGQTHRHNPHTHNLSTLTHCHTHTHTHSLATLTVHTSRVQATYPLHPKQSKDVDEEQIEEGDIAQLVPPAATERMLDYIQQGRGSVLACLIPTVYHCKVL